MNNLNLHFAILISNFAVYTDICCRQWYLRLVVHVAWMGQVRKACGIFVGKVLENGRFQSTKEMEDNISIDLAEILKIEPNDGLQHYMG